VSTDKPWVLRGYIRGFGRGTRIYQRFSKFEKAKQTVIELKNFVMFEELHLTNASKDYDCSWICSPSTYEWKWQANNKASQLKCKELEAA
jgi:hypothetical protein